MPETDHLKPYQFKPGQSGNPKGRPARPSFESIVANILDEKIPTTDMKKREALARVFVDMMLQRNPAMMREYLLREWPAVLRHELSGEGGGPIEVTRTDEWDAFARALPVVEVGSGANGKGGNGSAKPNGGGSK